MVYLYFWDSTFFLQIEGNIQLGHDCKPYCRRMKKNTITRILLQLSICCTSAVICLEEIKRGHGLDLGGILVVPK